MKDLLLARPTRGALVRVRGDVWIVTDIDWNGSTHHRCRLLSVSEDHQGRTLDVIWEVEPGRAVLDDVLLPTPTLAPDGSLIQDDPRILDAFLNAVRWGAVTNADVNVLESPYRSGIEIVDYQMEPLVRALDMPRITMLIADDVGLGKTIEAGLIVQELHLRHRMRNCLVVCPAGLQDKWQKEMWSRFGIEFRILNSAFVSEVRRRNVNLNPFKAYPHLITSIDWIKRPERSRIIEDAFVGDPDEYPRKFDVLILDEAHLAAPAGDTYALDSDRTMIMRHLSPFFEHRLFLTATPHNGHESSFFALLELLDPRRFSKNVEPTAEERDRVMVRRLKADIRLVDKDAPFPERELHAVSVGYHPHEEEAYDRLAAYLARLEQMNKDRPAARTAAKFVGGTLRKRLLSSPAGFASTIRQHQSTLVSRGRHVTGTSEQRALRTALDRAADSFDTDEAAADATADAVKLASRTLVYDDTLKGELEWLVGWGAAHDRSDSGRLDALITLVDRIRRPDGRWTDERLIVFTEYLDTHKYLYEKLVAAGVPPARIGEMTGGMDPDTRAHVADLFNHPPGDDEELGTSVRILLCTDTASEGIDLHLNCHHLLHYDVPWNPSRMEQRNGRIDRHGQPSPTADVYHFTGEGRTSIGRDTRIERRVADKLSNVLTDLGGANPLFDKLASAHSAALAGDEAALDAYEQQVEAHRSRTALRATEQRLRRLMDEVKRRLDTTKQELDVSPSELAHTVNVALALTHQPTLGPVDGTPGLFHVPALSDEWADTLRDLVDPVTLQRRLLTFDADLGDPAPGPLYAHLNHPLVAHATALLRAQVWSTTTRDQLHRITSRLYDPSVIDGDYDWIGDLAVVAHARVLITGADGNRLHEEVVARAARFRSGRWAQLDADVHADLLWQARLDESRAGDETLLAEWDRVADNLINTLVARGRRVAELRQQDLDKRIEAELKALEADVDRAAEEMRKALDRVRKELDDPQQTLFGADETAQLEADFQRLSDRYLVLHDNVQAEIENVRSRYRTKDVRVFPIAITFLHPAEGSGHG